jgi:hypothetical protein
LTNLTGVSFSYTVPTGANRIVVTWSFECRTYVLFGNPSAFARITVDASAASGDTGDLVACNQSDPVGVALTRAFDVTSGSTVTVRGQGKTSSGTSYYDDNFMTVIPGTQ